MRLYPEPENPYDSNAIAFQCCVQDEWRRAGYIVKEALPDLHYALRDDVILSVKLAWLSFYYAGVDVGQGSMQE